MKPVVLSNFNNISKALSLSVYRFVYAGKAKDENCENVKDALKNLNDLFSALRLQKLLESIAIKIDAKVLSSSKQTYLPQGASAAMLLEESSKAPSKYVKLRNPDAKSKSLAFLHLDKSHFAAHTYPEIDLKSGVASIRVDFDLSTCGEISPLTALPDLFNALTPDVAVVDYRLRGYTKDATGNKCYSDFPFQSFSQVFSEEEGFTHFVPSSYEITESNLPENGFFSATLLKNDFGLSNLTDSLKSLPDVLSIEEVNEGLAFLKDEATSISKLQP